MIILHEKLLESESKKQSHSASPSSFFKSKWIEEKEQKKTFDHLYREEIEALDKGDQRFSFVLFLQSILI